MTRLMLLCAAVAASLALLLPTTPAQAAGTNIFSYVSNTGNDSNNCASPATACTTFMHALAETQNFGEIDCVNTGYYGNVAIQQSVTIDCAGGVGSSFGGILLNYAGIVVRLRNLSINQAGNGGIGIDAPNQAALYIDNCVITNANPAVVSNTPFLGIHFAPSAGESLLVVNNTILSDNGNGSSGGGIEIAPTSDAVASVVLDGVKMTGNTYGMGLTSAGGTIAAVLRHSVIAGSTVSGIVAAGGGSQIFLTIEDSTIANNPSYGVQTLGSGVNVQISSSTITGNGTGVSGPDIASFGNNRMSLNGVNGSFTSTTPLQ